MSGTPRGSTNKLKLALMRAQELRQAGREAEVAAPARQDPHPVVAPQTRPLSRPQPQPHAPAPAHMPAPPWVETEQVAGPTVEAAPVCDSDVVRLTALCRDGEFSDEVRVLRTRVLEALESVGGTSVLVTSPGRGEGKSFTARHLAASLAGELGCPTVLVEVDGDSTVATSDGRRLPGGGLAGCLAGHASVGHVVLHSDVPRLRWVPSGRAPEAKASEPTASEVEGFLGSLRKHCGDALLIVDGPCVLGRTDTLVFGRFVDRTLLVVRPGQTKSKDVRRAVELLGERRLLGVVCNGERR